MTRFLCPFQQHFSHITTTVGDNERLCAIEQSLGLERLSPQVGLEPGTAES